MVDFIIFYMLVGYVINNTLALIAIFGAEEDEEVSVDLGNFLVTLPIWPYSLYKLIKVTINNES